MKNCPWCGAARVPSRHADKYPNHVDWGCGSCKHGVEPWQAPECRANELEAKLEKAEAEIDALKARLAEPEKEEER